VRRAVEPVHETPVARRREDDQFVDTLDLLREIERRSLAGPRRNVRVAAAELLPLEAVEQLVDERRLHVVHVEDEILGEQHELLPPALGARLGPHPVPSRPRVLDPQLDVSRRRSHGVPDPTQRVALQPRQVLEDRLEPRVAGVLRAVVVRREQQHERERRHFTGRRSNCRVA
jgi:hypothetical protein